MRALIFTGVPLRVSVKSDISTPVTASLKLIATTPLLVLRGSGVTSTMSAVGAVVSTVNASVALAAKALLVASVIPDPVALRVRE